MKILDIKSTVFPEVKVIKFARFMDERGFFTEIYRKSDFNKIDFLKNQEFVQCNISGSKKGVIRGLHLQWNPYLDKLVRVVDGIMVDLFLDIRLNSPTFGKIGIYELNNHQDSKHNEWIWIPKGFAHGSVFKEETVIEYFCTAEYNSKNEASIYPLAPDINWSLVDPSVKKFFEEFNTNNTSMSEKDQKGYTLAQWVTDKKSQNFIYTDKNGV